MSLNNLDHLIRKDDHGGVIRVVNELISSGIEDPKIIQCKIVALLHLDKYDEAVVSCGNKKEFSYLKAYGLYKLDKFEESIAILETLDKSISSNLRAQIYYRTRDYNAAVRMYEEILQDLHNDECDEFDIWDARLNLAAGLVSAGRTIDLLHHPELKSVIDDVLEGDVESRAIPYELIFNIGTALMDEGETGLAAKAFQLALIHGEKYMREEQNMSNQEIADHLAPIRAQAAVLLQSSGYYSLSNSIFSSLSTSITTTQPSNSGKVASPLTVTSDKSTLSVASVNQIPLSQTHKDLMVTLRRMQQSLSEAVPCKLTTLQIVVLHINIATLTFFLNQTKQKDSGIRELVQHHLTKALDLLSPFPSNVMVQYLRDYASFIQSLLSNSPNVDFSGYNLRSLFELQEVVSTGNPDTISKARLKWTSTLKDLIFTTLSKPEVSSVAGAFSKKTFSHFTTLPLTLVAMYSLLAPPEIKAALDHIAGVWRAELSRIRDLRKSDNYQTLALYRVEQWRLTHALVILLLMKMTFLDQDLAESKEDFVAQIEAIGSEILGFLNEEPFICGAGDSDESLESAAFKAAVYSISALAINPSPLVSTYFKKAKEMLHIVETARGNIVSPKIAESRSGLGLSIGSAPANNSVNSLSLGLGKLNISKSASHSTTPSVDIEFEPIVSSKKEAKPQAPPADSSAVAPTHKTIEEIDAMRARRSAARRRRNLVIRAKKREIYMKKLEESGRFALTGILKPNPDRWLSKADRMRRNTRNASGSGKKYVGASALQGGQDAAFESRLDAKSRADKNAARAAAYAASNTQSRRRK